MIGLFRVALLSAVVAVATACSCLPPDPDASKCDADYVLHGVGVAQDFVSCDPNFEPDDPNFGTSVSEFKVTTVFRQPDGSTLSDGDTVTIRSPAGGNLCGYRVDPDVTYLLYANAQAAKECEPADMTLDLGTALCSGNVVDPSRVFLAEVADDCKPMGPTCEEECDAFCERRCSRKCGGNRKCAARCDQRCTRRCERGC